MRKIVLVNAALLALVLGLFDLGAYWLVPDRALAALPAYRASPRPSEPGVSAYSQGYYVANAARGFDIGERRAARIWVDGTYYPIRSNGIGCFDRDHTDYADYVYFAGDSFTWGNARFEDTFGALLEQATGTAILKCGVEHTGQRHQFAKFVEITTRTASVPRAVFVFHFENDVANDYAYPHSTVIDGWLVDTVVTNDRHELIRRSPQELEARLAEQLEWTRRHRLKRDAEDASVLATLKAAVRRYSLSVNIFSAATWALRHPREPVASGPAGNAPPEPVTTQSFYTMPYLADGVYSYRDNPFARDNQDAILDFKRWTDARRVPFVVVLIPRRREAFDPSFYGDMHRFLDAHQIRFLDLADSFRQQRREPGDLYWRFDPHFNRAGHAAVARVLQAGFPEHFRAR